VLRLAWKWSTIRRALKTGRRPALGGMITATAMAHDADNRMRQWIEQGRRGLHDQQEREGGQRSTMSSGKRLACWGGGPASLRHRDPRARCAIGRAYQLSEGERSASYASLCPLGPAPVGRRDPAGGGDRCVPVPSTHRGFLSLVLRPPPPPPVALGSRSVGRAPAEPVRGGTDPAGPGRTPPPERLASRSAQRPEGRRRTRRG